MLDTAAIVVARLIFAGAFGMAMVMKFTGIDATAGAIASIGFPLPVFFAWVAAFFELGLVLAFLTGAFFREAAVLAAAYVLFLGFAFYGPAKWGDMMMMGLFINHLTFLAGLLYAAVYGPGRARLLDWSLPWQLPGESPGRPR